MPIEIIIDESKLAGFSEPAKDRLRDVVLEYSLLLVREANRIESSRNTGHGPAEVNSAMVNDAAVVQRQGLGPPRQSRLLKCIKIAAALLCAFSGYMFDPKSLQSRLYLVVFILMISGAVVTVTISIIKE